MEMAQYLNVFMDECQEHLHTLNASLLALESDPDNSALLEAIFRAAHTLKGASATMGFNKMANITHAMEDVLTRIRTGDLAISPEIVNLLFECFDLLDALAQGIATGREEEIETTGLLTQLRFIASGGRVEQRAPVQQAKKEIRPEYTSDEKNMIDQALAAGMHAYHLNVRLRPDCLLRGARAFMVLRALEKSGQIIRTWPSAKDLEDENFEDTFIVSLVTTEQAESPKSAALSVTDVEAAEVNSLDPANIPLVAGEAGLRKEAGQQVTTRSFQSPRAATSQTVRVEIRKLDDLMNLVAEMVIQRSRLEQLSGQLGSKDLTESVEQLTRLTIDLRDRVLRTRMVQVDNVFSRFPRLIRDLSRELGKEVQLEIVGGETELDRTVIDQIGDPLMHLIRNALDHGIESPEERLAAGKPPIGKISMIAYQESNTVVIVIQDDGRGIDPEKLRFKAVQMGILSATDTDFSRERLLELVYVPGLSTAQNITDVSGRGVGMDVVKQAIEGLGGVISLRSDTGRGTAIHIRLPLTLAIIQTLLVKIGPEVYAIPSSYIEQTVSVSQNEILRSRDQEITILRGESLPLLRLNRLLDVPDSAGDIPELDVVVTRVGERRVGCVVDHLIRQQDIVIKPLGGYLGRIEGIAGATVLGDGRVALILDIRALG